MEKEGKEEKQRKRNLEKELPLWKTW
jgi:hypothetical protein